MQYIERYQNMSVWNKKGIVMKKVYEVRFERRTGLGGSISYKS